MIEPEKRRSDFDEILAVTIIVVSCFFAFTYFLTVVLGSVIFFSTPEGVAASITPMKHGLLVWLFVVIFFYIPITPTVGVVFIFLVSVFFLCLLAAWKFRESFHNVIRKGSSRPVRKLFNNFLVVLPIITSMLLMADLAIVNLQSSAGLPTEPPPTDPNPFIELFIINYMVLIEEIGFRISPIGLFLIIHIFGAGVRHGIKLCRVERLKLFFTALLYLDAAKKEVGLKTVSDFGIRGGISLGEWVMIFLTSFAWGVAHFLVGGWTVGKFTSVFINGLVFGLTYIVYGAYAPILLHWFFNYYLLVLGNLSLNYYPYLLPISSLAALLMFAVGIGGWITFAIIGVKKLLKLRPKPPSRLPPPLDQTSSPFEKDTT